MSRSARAGNSTTRALSPIVRLGVGVVAATVLLASLMVIARAARDGVASAPGGWGTVIVSVVAVVLAVRALRAAIRGTITVRAR